MFVRISFSTIHTLSSSSTHSHDSSSSIDYSSWLSSLMYLHSCPIPSILAPPSTPNPPSYAPDLNLPISSSSSFTGYYLIPNSSCYLIPKTSCHLVSSTSTNSSFFTRIYSTTTTSTYLTSSTNKHPIQTLSVNGVSKPNLC